MGHGQAFSGRLYPISEASGLNWCRLVHNPASPLRMQTGGIEGGHGGRQTDGIRRNRIGVS